MKNLLAVAPLYALILFGLVTGTLNGIVKTDEQRDGERIARADNLSLHLPCSKHCPLTRKQWRSLHERPTATAETDTLAAR